MKVIRVKAKVAQLSIKEQMYQSKIATLEDTLANYSSELASTRSQIMGLKHRNAQLEADLEIEKKNHNLALGGVQLWQNEAEKYKVEARKGSGYESLYHAAKSEAEEWEKASQDLASRLCVQMDETRKAEEVAADLKMELMEREARINELERRIEWLETHSDTKA